MVPGEGPRNAKIALVGEAPGDQEVKTGRPFVGPAGQLLDGLLQEVGLERRDCYITNILQEQPNPSGSHTEARNDFGILYQGRKRAEPTERLTQAVTRLHEEIASIHPNLVVALGNEPLKWLTGKSGISDWRGSVLEGGILKGGNLFKVLGTYHPAAINRQWSWRPITVFDLKKATQEMAFPEVRRRPRVSEVPSNLIVALQAIQGLKTPLPVAFDIEVETQQIQSIAFSNHPENALCIPIWWGEKGSLWSFTEEKQLWTAIQDLFETTPMIAQNAMYDLTYLKEYGIYARHLVMDTMIAFHVLYPELPKGLAFMCSLYTDQPFYKWMRTTSDQQEFWRYNCLDAMVTLECSQEIEKELQGL